MALALRFKRRVLRLLSGPPLYLAPRGEAVERSPPSGPFLGWQEASMSHARPITQQEWNRKHLRQEHRQRQNETISQVGVLFSVAAMLVVLYFVTMVP